MQWLPTYTTPTIFLAGNDGKCNVGGCANKRNKIGNELCFLGIFG